MNRQRGTGLTTEQIKSAPIGAVYIWCDGHTHYPIALARALGRTDLKIKPPAWLGMTDHYSMEITGIVLDHATRLTDRQYVGYCAVIMRLRPK